MQVSVNSDSSRNTFLCLDKATNGRYTMAQKVFIKNFGCSSNTADGETLAGCLAQAGFTLATSEAEADLIIYNTCAVKGPTENRIIDDIKHAPKNKKIVVAGCLPKNQFRTTYHAKPTLMVQLDQQSAKKSSTWLSGFWQAKKSSI